MNRFSFTSALERSERKFKERIKSIADEIRREANGRTCGECDSFSNGMCLTSESPLSEGHLSCQCTAVACSHFQFKVVIVSTEILRNIENYEEVTPVQHEPKVEEEGSPIQMAVEQLLRSTRKRRITPENQLSFTFLKEMVF